MLWRMKEKKMEKMSQNNWITGKSTPKKEEINMPGYIRKNSKQKRHPTISWTPFYNYKSLIESLYNSNHNAIEIL